MRSAAGIVLDPAEIELRFVRSPGPGGQNVNKVSTAVELRFDARRSPSLPEGVRARLEVLAGNRLTADGVIVISASRFRTQGRNREDAIERLLDLIRRAAVVPKARRATRPTLASRERRLGEKRTRGQTKATRGRVKPEE